MNTTLVGLAPEAMRISSARVRGVQAQVKEKRHVLLRYTGADVGWNFIDEVVRAPAKADKHPPRQQINISKAQALQALILGRRFTD
ncbi:hypothetical protein SSTU70S_00675 [Stutzerimonas stutzeri]